MTTEQLEPQVEATSDAKGVALEPGAAVAVALDDLTLEQKVDLLLELVYPIRESFEEFRPMLEQARTKLVRRQSLGRRFGGGNASGNG